MTQENDATDRLTRYEADVLRSARENHIWINAFATIGPTDEFLRQIGQSVLDYLKNEANCIQADYDSLETLRDLRQPELILRINRS